MKDIEIIGYAIQLGQLKGSFNGLELKAIQLAFESIKLQLTEKEEIKKTK